MDIEPLWALGGWFIFLDCMATPNTTSKITETYTKSHFLLLLCTLCFIFLLLISPTNTINPSKRRLLDSSATSTMNFLPKQTKATHTSSSKSTRKEFGAAAHEVPSGPNPISNR
ncbi:hypothetical protein CFOL_v3_14181 [Cephalotus follicularis]|uniref:Uncharacterized protein n=1 Tax=Cephalotus follicularis TaxID=3775 RepID=A0A1Q3BSC0_CEPFO|nr:hypothetical protein CFOL_v3_14181 [Cephalotus follicularis]